MVFTRFTSNLLQFKYPVWPFATVHHPVVKATTKSSIKQQPRDACKFTLYLLFHIVYPELQVEVVGVDGELKDIARSVLRTRPMFAYTFEEVNRWLADDWYKGVLIFQC